MANQLTSAPQHIDLSTWALSRRIMRTYLTRYWRGLLVALLFMIIAAGLTTAFAKLLQPVIDKMLEQKRADLILPLSALVFITFSGNGIATYVHSVILNKIGQRIVTDIQRDLFSRFMDLDLSFFHDNPSGQLSSRVINDVTVLRSAITDTVTGFGENFFTLIFLVVLMFFQDWRLALIAFGVFPIAGFFVGKLGRKLRRLSGGIQAEIASLADVLSQIFQGVRQVKAYGMEDYERKRAGKAIDNVRRMYFRSISSSFLSTPLNQTMIGVAMTSIIVYGGYRIAAGHLTVGKLMSFIAAFSLAYEPLKKLAKLNNSLQMGLGAASRVFDMLDRRPSIVDAADAVALAATRPRIVFDQVSFAYADGTRALDGVSFVAEAGQVTALVGPSGGGKTTALNMVPRFYDILSGGIGIDGVDIRGLTIASLRQHIALVSQDVTIFDDTVHANIAYGRPGASHQEIAAAARAAAAEDFILALPLGFETRLGENGVKLSGGQRQRISIARAILRDAPILLLDEATSALDNESERLIQASLERLQKGRTTLVIAHRLSTVQSADRIVVLEHGRVTEDGKPADLLASGGIYARMHSLGLSDARSDANA